MLNISAFRPVVHEKKIFEHLSKFSLFCLLLVEIGLEVLEKKSFKGKS